MAAGEDLSPLQGRQPRALPSHAACSHVSPCTVHAAAAGKCTQFLHNHTKQLQQVRYAWRRWQTSQVLLASQPAGKGGAWDAVRSGCRLHARPHVQL